MPPKRKIRNLPAKNDQMSFFDPVYQNDAIAISDDENENDLLADGIPRPTFSRGNKNESNETLDNDTIINSDQEQSSEIISTSKLISRVRQIQKSIHQARTMLESMEKFKNMVPGCDEQRRKLHSIIANLEEQQASYVNLLNLITLTAEEHSAILNENPKSRHRQAQDDEDDNDDDLSLRGNVQSPVRPRIESKMGFIPQVIPTVLPTLNLSDNEQTTRNDYSNYDSLVGSLKSDTITWKDQQATSDDEASDAASEKEMERNLTLQKEQLRALQGQQRALLALKRRSEQHLTEQQQLTNKQNANPKENDLLSDINHLRNRLKLLRNRYEQKHQVELQQLKKSSKTSPILTENRLKNLEHVRERLDELEQIVTYYQGDLNNEHEEETAMHVDDEPRMKTSLKQHATNNNQNAPKQLDKLSSELTTKRLELEQAKSALSQLQQMVKKIQPDGYSSSARSTPRSMKSLSRSNDVELDSNQMLYNPRSSQQTQTETSISNGKSARLSNSHSPQQVPKSLSSTNHSVDVQMAAQHREIERLVDSRQRLHTIKDRITSLHQSMTTPPIPSKTYEDKLNDSRNIRPVYNSNPRENFSQDDNQSESSRFEYESDDDDADSKRSRLKQSNFCAPKNLPPKNDQTPEELNTQMRDICRCLSTFIDEQKSFNRHIEQRLTTATNTPVSQPTDSVFNQLQQQVLTQGLIVNLNTAYREIAVLQSEINALQSENNRLTSSISFDHQYHHHHIPRAYSREDSKESIYSFDQIIRPLPRSSFDEQSKQQQQLLTTERLFENSSKTSFNSQSTGNQTAIHVEKVHTETTPIKQERNATFTADSSSSHSRSKQNSKIYDLPVHPRHPSKENLSKSFTIHRRSIPTDKHVHTYQSTLDQHSSVSSIDQCQQSQELTFDDEQPSNDFSTSVLKVSSSSYHTPTNQDSNHVDTQTIDLQVKSIMVQLIPFMRLHINEIFNQAVLNHIRERILFLFKQQPDSAPFVRQYQGQFSELLETTIEKYCGTTIRECAADLIHDVSDVAFDALIKYKMYEQTIHSEQKDQYSHLYDPLIRYQRQDVASFGDGENDNKYQIELAELENQTLTLMASDDEDNNSDQEESQDSEVETAVLRRESNLRRDESPISKEFHSNGHEYILVNRSINDNHTHANEEKENEDIDN